MWTSAFLTEKTVPRQMFTQNQDFQLRDTMMPQVLSASQPVKRTQKGRTLTQQADTTWPGSNVSTSDAATKNLNPRPAQETRRPRKRGQIHINQNTNLALLNLTPLAPTKGSSGVPPRPSWLTVTREIATTNRYSCSTMEYQSFPVLMIARLMSITASG